MRGSLGEFESLCKLEPHQGFSYYSETTKTVNTRIISGRFIVLAKKTNLM